LHLQTLDPAQMEVTIGKAEEAEVDEMGSCVGSKRQKELRKS